mmetsp:Transcript_24055/g.54203  ORF Transcript_24055/g.54203 Transcript_24055/m.54203 type:complete len:221 (-) Transcript_24055:563-1225(-)
MLAAASRQSRRPVCLARNMSKRSVLSRRNRSSCSAAILATASCKGSVEAKARNARVGQPPSQGDMPKSTRFASAALTSATPSPAACSVAARYLAKATFKMASHLTALPSQYGKTSCISASKKPRETKLAMAASLRFSSSWSRCSCRCRNSSSARARSRFRVAGVPSRWSRLQRWADVPLVSERRRSKNSASILFMDRTASASVTGHLFSLRTRCQSRGNP